MTLTPEQWDKIWAGIPNTFTIGDQTYNLSKIQADQLINQPTRPVIVVHLVSQGQEVTPVQPMGDGILLEGDPATGDAVIRRCRYGQICKARVQIVIESHDLDEARNLASRLSQDLYCFELGINPIADQMQFRGADPPESLPHYTSARDRKLVQRFGITVFVEYRFCWDKDFPVIREVKFDFSNSPAPNVYHIVAEGARYSIDVIITK